MKKHFFKSYGVYRLGVVLTFSIDFTVEYVIDLRLYLFNSTLNIFLIKNWNFDPRWEQYD